MTTGCDWGPGPDTIVPNKLAENMCGSQGVDTRTSSPVANPHHTIRSNRPKQKYIQETTTKTDVKQCRESLKSLQLQLKTSAKQTVKRTEKNKQEKQKQRRKNMQYQVLTLPINNSTLYNEKT